MLRDKTQWFVYRSVECEVRVWLMRPSYFSFINTRIIRFDYQPTRLWLYFMWGCSNTTRNLTKILSTRKRHKSYSVQILLKWQNQIHPHKGYDFINMLYRNEYSAERRTQWYQFAKIITKAVCCMTLYSRWEWTFVIDGNKGFL